ncbi:MAG: type VI secretion system lipoprotein TssJ [Pseudomonadota bacterium]
MPNKHGIAMVRVLIAVSLLAFLTAACSHAPDPAPSYGYGEKGISFQLAADKQLNAYDGAAHSLLVVVYQVTDINPFKKLAQSEDGLRTLLEVKSADPSFVASQKFFIEPGESQSLVLDRAEKATWVAVVAGFYRLVPAKATRSFEIPFKVETKGIIFRKQVAEIQPLQVNLLLGPDSIQEKK